MVSLEYFVLSTNLFRNIFDQYFSCAPNYSYFRACCCIKSLQAVRIKKIILECELYPFSLGELQTFIPVTYETKVQFILEYPNSLIYFLILSCYL